MGGGGQIQTLSPIEDDDFSVLQVGDVPSLEAILSPTFSGFIGETHGFLLRFKRQPLKKQVRENGSAVRFSWGR